MVGQAGQLGDKTEFFNLLGRGGKASWLDPKSILQNRGQKGRGWGLWVRAGGVFLKAEGWEYPRFPQGLQDWQVSFSEASPVLLRGAGHWVPSPGVAWLPAWPQTHGLPVRAQPLLGVQHVVDAPAIALQQVLAALLACPRALAGREGKVLPAAFLALQDPAQADRKAR